MCLLCAVIRTGLHHSHLPINGYYSFSTANWYQQCKTESLRVAILTIIKAVRRNVLRPIMKKLSRNQVHQITPLVIPLFFIASFRRISFSSTILFTVMETEYIQASTMKMGKARFKVIMKLPKQEGINQI